MMQTSPYVVTISRQLGSGGGYIGQCLARRLGIPCVDREILSEAAKQLKLLEEELECREEKVTSFWESFMSRYAYSQDAYVPPQFNAPSDRELYSVESKIIKEIAAKNSSIIVGRAGSYILQNHTKHLSVFIHADISFRMKRIQEMYNISEKQAKKVIENSDRDRTRYFNMISEKDWTDARQYHICIDTGVLGLERAEEILFNCIKARFA